MTFTEIYPRGEIMKVISLFSGAGGLDLGFMLAGHKIVWGNDFEKQAIDTYKENIGKFQEVEHMQYGDITQILGKNNDFLDNEVPEAEIVIGGFPCQGFSLANISRNMGDQRNFLYLELLRTISRKKPDFFLAENVKGLESMEKGKVLEMILDDFELAGTEYGYSGYTVYYNVFNTADYGVPQKRERVIIFGVRNDIKDNIKMPIKDFGNKNKRKMFYIKPTHSKNGTIVEKIKPYTKMNKAFSSLKENKYDEIRELFNPNSEELFIHRTVKDAIGNLPLEWDIDSLKYNNHFGTKTKVKINGMIGNRETMWDKPSPTIMGRGSGTGGPLIIPHPELHRRMTIREVARIQRS
jgi:DNA (cytosine-5)-methyltransferase 1